MHTTSKLDSRCSFLIFLMLASFMFGSPHINIIKLSLATESVSNITCIDAEREALLGFKQGLTDPTGRLSSWVGDHCCLWSGVGCNNLSGNVIMLDLRNPFPFTSSGYGIDSTTAAKRSCLGGEINSSLLDLKYLDYLDLSLNDFEGIQIPDFFGMLKKLRYLNLSFSSFAGDIPPHLGNLSSLNYLDLYADSYISPRMYNLRTANLQWFSGLSSLKLLNMGQVNLINIGSEWVEAVNMLPSLVELHLPGCGLESLPLSLPFINFTLLSVLDISNNYFDSSVPNWLLNLTSLAKLDLSWNSFGGTPREFVNLGSLCMLQILNLSRNNFSGEIGEFFDDFSSCPNNSLVSLDLSTNHLVGELPDSLRILKNLQRLDLSENSFWGSIPASIGNLSSLQELDLSFNKMNGTIPESFGQLSQLTHLYLGLNPWEGVITEAHLMNLTSLQHLILTADTVKSLVFSVTYEWVPPFRLITLNLDNCLVGPRFPVWLRVQSELNYVALTNVGIEDTIPEEWFSNISSQITTLDLSNNQIKGKLPNQLKSPKLSFVNLSYNLIEGSLPFWSTNVSHFYIQRNLFSGPIPANIGELMPQLDYLYLSDNRLNGTIPTSICAMQSLQVLSLRNNWFSRGLPQCWNELQRLGVVDVANNNLSGDIPSSLGLMSSLNILMLSNNSLDGEIPSSLQNCSELMSIDLGGNILSGNLPLWIGENVTGFWMLRLRSNSLSGTIPRQWCNLPNLHILDLAHNNFSGVIPSCIGNLASLVDGDSGTVHKNYLRSVSYYYEEQAIVVTKGQELGYSRTLKYVNSIDLSGNSLMGEIPKGITNLTALGTLNLSINHLTGYIPEEIGNVRWLETLDLSNNNLSGPIPQSISSLTSLSHLNLSFNNLEGRIPSGNQLQTLDDSSIYEGNPLLCGIPHVTKCPGDDDVASNAPPGGLENNSDENDSEMLWFYVSMACGFVVGLCGVCCTLWLKESWRKAYFRYVRII